MAQIHWRGLGRVRIRIRNRIAATAVRSISDCLLLILLDQTRSQFMREVWVCWRPTHHLRANTYRFPQSMIGYNSSFRISCVDFLELSTFSDLLWCLSRSIYIYFYVCLSFTTHTCWVYLCILTPRFINTPALPPQE